MESRALDPTLNQHRAGVQEHYRVRAKAGEVPEPHQFLKALKMCAAMWGVFYEADREFDVVLFTADESTGGLLIVDAADLGAYSIRAEGLLCRYHLQNQVLLQPEAIGATKSADSEFWFATIKRSDWDGAVCSAQDWNDLLKDIDKQFDSFWSSDKRFLRQAAAWLKDGKPCVAQACSKLAEEFR
jgi:hypothetical protein